MGESFNLGSVSTVDGNIQLACEVFAFRPVAVDNTNLFALLYKCPREVEAELASAYNEYSHKRPYLSITRFSRWWK